MSKMSTNYMMTKLNNWILGKLGNITALIPSQASSSNKLADKAFVNSSIATATATFRGTYNLVSDLSLTISATQGQIATALASAISTADNNDYAFVQIPTSDSTPTEIARIDKYKYNGVAWAFEYSLNNSGFTAAQWSAINSGITSAKVGKLDDLPTNSELTALLNGKQNVISDLSTIRSGASAGATAVQPASMASTIVDTVAESGVFDLSVHNAVNGVPATYADLSAALTALNALPADYKKGGMSVKYVQSSDNKYVQYMCKTSTWSSILADWEKVNNVSVSQNTSTGHIDINIGGITNPVASVEDVGQICEFPMVSNKYVATNGTITTGYSWSTTGWISIDAIPIFNNQIKLSHETSAYQTVVYPVLFKDENNAITTLSMVGTTYQISDIPSGTKYVAFNMNAILDSVGINKLSSAINKNIADIIDINSAIENIAQFKYIGTTSNPLDSTLIPGLYAINTNPSNVPSDYLSGGYGWLLVVKTDFKLLWSLEKGVYWAHLSPDVNWKNMSETAYQGASDLSTSIVYFINTAIQSGALTLSDTPQTVAQSYPKNYLATNGNLVSYDNVLWNVDKYSVIPGTIYHVVASKQYNNLVFAFYDASGKMLQGVGDGTSAVQIFDSIVIAPYNAAYMYVAYKTDVKVGSLSISQLEQGVERLRWAGKKWVAIGDSLTEVNSRTTKHYFDYIAEKTGITVVNMGLSGSGYRRKFDTNQAFYQRAANVPTDADVITIFGSFNDLGVADYNVGTPVDTGVDTICGCINNTLDTILSVYMNAEKVPTIGVITPTPWIGTGPADPTNSSSLYCDAVIACCKRKSIPVLDLFRCSNLHPNDATFRTLAYSKDEGNGVHPDETGHKIIAPMFENFLESLLLN